MISCLRKILSKNKLPFIGSYLEVSIFRLRFRAAAKSSCCQVRFPSYVWNFKNKSKWNLPHSLKVQSCLCIFKMKKKKKERKNLQMIAQSHIPHNYKKSKFLQSQILQNCLEMTQQQHQLTCQRARCRSRNVKHLHHLPWPCHWKVLSKL